MSARQRAGTALLVAVGVFVLLSVPAAAPDLPPSPAPARPFRWDRDSLWRSLESSFRASRDAGCPDTAAIRTAVASLHRSIAALDTVELPPDSPRLDALEASFFAAAPGVAACGTALAEFVAAHAAMRDQVKRQSRRWDVATAAARDRLYRSLYGGRAAVEEVVLQQAAGVDGLLRGTDEPSSAPAAVVRGVTLHSGDLLVSRGGYPTSALIARGNDYPGNFSHVGLVQVDDATGEVRVIEARIERGVAVGSAEEYLADKKLRVMVLRLRADLPQLAADPLLPHRAATAMLDRASTEHIPYDFAMDYRDPARLFCSEVASSTYRDHGVTLWAGISTLSSPGLRRWLSSFGVRHFETQEPSDLEYDPQLVVVAEWRDPVELFRDRVDNAVTDAMLEGAERGDALDYRWHELPLARLARGYGWVAATLGGTGPIPEGMTAAAALRHRRFTARHADLAARTTAAADTWRATRGYPPPYWALVGLAREAAAR